MLLVFLGSIWVVLHLVAQSCLTLCDPMDCIAHQSTLSMGILQARILGWVAMHSSRGSSKPSDQTQVSHVAGDSLLFEPPRKSKNTGMGSLSLLQGSFLTQESNRGLWHFRWILYQLSYQIYIYIHIHTHTIWQYIFPFFKNRQKYWFGIVYNQALLFSIKNF